MPSCAEGGILGALTGVMGSMQAIEVVKELLGIGQTHAGHLLIYDALTRRQRRIGVTRDPGCRLCGLQPQITALETAEN